MEVRSRAKLPNCSISIQPNQMADHVTFASGDVSDLTSTTKPRFLKLAFSLTHTYFCTSGFLFPTRSLVSVMSTDVIKPISLTLFFPLHCCSPDICGIILFWSGITNILFPGWWRLLCLRWTITIKSFCWSRLLYPPYMWQKHTQKRYPVCTETLLSVWFL